jgi:hypothetical protein
MRTWPKLPTKLPKVGEPVYFYSSKGVRKKAVVLDVSERFSAVRLSMSRPDGSTWVGWKKFPRDFEERPYGFPERRAARRAREAGLDAASRGEGVGP